MINSVVEGCNSSLKATKIRQMGHLEIMQIFCSFTSGWNNLNRWIFKGNLFLKKHFVFYGYFKRVQDCVTSGWWITSSSRCVPYQWSYTVGNPQVICHIQEKQNVGRADTPKGYRVCSEFTSMIVKPQCQRSHGRHHGEGRVLEPTGARKPSQSWREPCQETLAGLWALQFIWLHWIFILCAASAWRQSCGERKMGFLKNLVADQCDWPHIGPWLDQSSWLLEI